MKKLLIFLSLFFIQNIELKQEGQSKKINSEKTLVFQRRKLGLSEEKAWSFRGESLVFQRSLEKKTHL